MNAKNLIAVALLVFVAAAVVILVKRELREPTADATDSVAEQQPHNALVVYYFHGTTRCPTCRNIEEYSHEAVRAGFPKELADEKVLWKVVNYEQPANSHFAKAYEIIAPTVVLVRNIDGKVTDWRNLSRVWELVGDQDAFTQYIQEETRSMLGS